MSDLSGKPPKASGDKWVASIASLLDASAEVIDSVNNAANGGSENNNTTQPSPKQPDPTTEKVNPLWIGLGVGSVVLLIIGLLIYTNNGNNTSKPSAASSS